MISDQVGIAELVGGERAVIGRRAERPRRDESARWDLAVIPGRFFDRSRMWAGWGLAPHG
jgi:hypothetical protein